MKTHKLVTAEADIVYDVYGPLPTADGRPPLFMIGGRIPRVLIKTRLLLAPIRRFWIKRRETIWRAPFRLSHRRPASKSSTQSPRQRSSRASEAKSRLAILTWPA